MATGDDQSGFDAWLAEKLDNLGLDSDVYGGYVSGIMGDEDNPEDERIDSVCEILSGATDESLDDFRLTLKDRWEVKEGIKRKEGEAVKAAKVQEMKSKKEEERRQVEEAEAAKKAKAEKVVQRSAEERAERARLLGEYGYDTDPVDEEGNPLPQEDGEGGGTGVDDSIGEAYGKNVNKELVRQEHAAKRDAIKKSHQATSLQNKIALEADKMRKELAKNARKTQKGERKSGRG